MSAVQRPEHLLAATNNAHWCDLVCRLHGAPGRFMGSVWVSSGAVPPLYPNLVTTTDHPARNLAEVTRLVADAPGRTLAVKDSFGRLELAPLGFSLLFDAEWFWRPASPLLAPSSWPRLTSNTDLAAWEAAWRMADGRTALPDKPMFAPPLLLDDGVQLLARRESGGIVAGAIVYRSQDTAGISNVFSPPDTAQDDFAACVALVMALNPSAAIAGYDRPGFAAPFAGLGLRVAGPLRVWLKAA